MGARYEVGMNVVCVDASIEPGQQWETGAELHERSVYTIATIIPEYNGKVGLLLEETRREDGWAYRASRFRPCQRTDISELKKLVVNPPRELVRETA